MSGRRRIVLQEEGDAKVGYGWLVGVSRKKKQRAPKIFYKFRDQKEWVAETTTTEIQRVQQ